MSSAHPSREVLQSSEVPFSLRVDRHGRPFGNRIPLPERRGQPIQNKIIPSTNTSREKLPSRTNASSHYRPTPPRHQTRDHPRPRSRSPQRQWREKTHHTGRQSYSEAEPCRSPVQITPKDTTGGHRLPLERNLELTDFPPPPSRIPS
ncbi:Uncharacterized protein Rs2_15108 [Raphanus sativus]|nr:Uncharacterized protein Rs2_15108 [Raphanus sativus]